MTADWFQTHIWLRWAGGGGGQTLLELMSVHFLLQIEGKLPISPQDDDKVKITVSIHGIKVLDMKAQVLQNFLLHS